MKPESIKILREIGKSVLGYEIGVRISLGESDEGTEGVAAQPLRIAADEARQEKQKLREVAEQHPAVQHFLRTFHGEILDVRRVEVDKQKGY